MAELYPFSNRTAELLRCPPAPGQTHCWLAKVACGLRHVLSVAQSFDFLRRCCDVFVTHRVVPDSEIEAAVDFAYSGNQSARINFGRGPLDWPGANPTFIARIIAEYPPAFDVCDTGLTAADVLPQLFRPGELVCSGRNTERAMVRTVEETTADAHLLQFIVVNPMRCHSALNNSGKPSRRCQNNTGARRYLVTEFDDRSLSKTQQARLITRLTGLCPLVMVVDSGGSSLHAWYRVNHLSAQDHVRFFCAACLMGADPSRWDVSGWLRMPGGLRDVNGVPSVRQSILFFNPEVLGA